MRYPLIHFQQSCMLHKNDDFEWTNLNLYCHLKVISMHGIGRDTIDVAAAKKRGIPVLNVPNQSMESVAELAVTQMLALSRNKKKQISEFTKVVMILMLK